eukprot:3807273-Rhodomonas_salina.2
MTTTLSCLIDAENSEEGMRSNGGTSSKVGLASWGSVMMYARRTVAGIVTGVVEDVSNVIDTAGRTSE